MLLLGVLMQPVAVEAIRSFSTRQQALASVTSRPDKFQGGFGGAHSYILPDNAARRPSPPPSRMSNRLTGLHLKAHHLLPAST